VTTDSDIDRQAKEDGTDVELPGLAALLPATVRRHLKLTQKDIAALVCVPVATWQFGPCFVCSGASPALCVGLWLRE